MRSAVACAQVLLFFSSHSPHTCVFVLLSFYDSTPDFVGSATPSATHMPLHGPWLKFDTGHRNRLGPFLTSAPIVRICSLRGTITLAIAPDLWELTRAFVIVIVRLSLITQYMHSPGS